VFCFKKFNFIVSLINLIYKSFATESESDIKPWYKYHKYNQYHFYNHKNNQRFIQLNLKRNKNERRRNIKSSFVIETDNWKFRHELKTINEYYVDPTQFCASPYNKTNHKQHLWVLRNKKCMNFSDSVMPFEEASNLCRDNLYSSTRLLHRNEIEVLIKDYHSNQTLGINFYNLYSKLTTPSYYQNKYDDVKSTFYSTTPSIWLFDNNYFYNECGTKDLAPVMTFNSDKCISGCYKCVNRTENHFSVCVKTSDFKVPYYSFCNTMDMKNYYLNDNLYYQTDIQTYVCQGSLKCVDYSCQCPIGTKIQIPYTCHKF
jgi:hypothetical protein